MKISAVTEMNAPESLRGLSESHLIPPQRAQLMATTSMARFHLLGENYYFEQFFGDGVCARSPFGDRESPYPSYVTVKLADAPEPCIWLGNASTKPLDPTISIASEYGGNVHEPDGTVKPRFVKFTTPKFASVASPPFGMPGSSAIHSAVIPVPEYASADVEDW